MQKFQAFTLVWPLIMLGFYKPLASNQPRVVSYRKLIYVSYMYHASSHITYSFCITNENNVIYEEKSWENTGK